VPFLKASLLYRSLVFSQLQDFNGLLMELIADIFGSKKGLIRHYYYKCLLIFGGYKQYQTVDWQSVNRLVFVCHGTICRSAFCEYFARSLGLNSASVGLECTDGNSADERAQALATIRSLNMSGHATMNVRNFKKQSGDLFIVMEPKHLHALKNLLGVSYQVTLIGLWPEKKNSYVHDPYSANQKYFNNCIDYLASCVEAIACKSANAEK
jgi:protein-tyrosine phosphatase